MEPTCVQPWYDNAIVGGVVSVLIGVFLAFFIEWIRSYKRKKAHWGALATEVQLCKKTAQQYIGREQANAPLYRMPLIAFKNSLGALVADGAMKEDEFRDLSRYYSWVEDINRGLDLATTARYQEGGTDGALYGEEVGRLDAKTRELVDDFFPAADAVVRRRCRKLPEIP